VYLVAGTYYLQVNYTESFTLEISVVPCVCNGTDDATACNVSCTCEQGYGYPGCSLCVENFFSYGSNGSSNPSPCIDCASMNNTMFHGVIGASGCACVGGHEWDHNTHACSPCPKNYYSTGGSNATCISCSTVNNTASSQNMGQAACMCAKGFGWDFATTNCLYGLSSQPNNSAAMPTNVPILWVIIALVIGSFVMQTKQR